MDAQQFTDWKTDAAHMAANAIHAKIETEKESDLANQGMIMRAVHDRLWTAFEHIVDDRAPHAVEAVLAKIAKMTIDELANMVHHIK
jgi:predicted component of type VI protein secretion system